MIKIDEMLIELLGGFGVFLSILLFILEVFFIIFLYEVIKMAFKRNKIAKSNKLYKPFGFKRNEKGYWMGNKMYHKDIVYSYCMDPFGEFGVMIKYNDETKFVSSSLIPSNVVVEKIKSL